MLARQRSGHQDERIVDKSGSSTNTTTTAPLLEQFELNAVGLNLVTHPLLLYLGEVPVELQRRHQLASEVW
jgi:hypothetical protein